MKKHILPTFIIIIYFLLSTLLLTHYRDVSAASINFDNCTGTDGGNPCLQYSCTPTAQLCEARQGICMPDGFCYPSSCTYGKSTSTCPSGYTCRDNGKCESGTIDCKVHTDEIPCTTDLVCKQECGTNSVSCSGGYCKYKDPQASNGPGTGIAANQIQSPPGGSPMLLKAPTPKDYVSCSGTTDPEWHSLRPYQASPCNVPINDDEQAILCGTDLDVHDKFTVYEQHADICIPYPYTCPPPPSTTCHFTIERLFQIYLDAFDSKLPIAGQTELVPGGETSKLPLEEKLRLTEWSDNDKLPPDPSTEANSSFQEYFKAYQDWRGKSCLESPVDIPIINKSIMFCFDNPLKNNFWANLFPSIPYSSTEDRIGKVASSDMFLIRKDFPTIVGPFTNWRPKPRDDRNKNTKNSEAVLYFPHMEENTELTSALQSTYLSQDLMKQDQPIKDNEIIKEDPGKKCKYVDIRSNPGDQLFGENMANGEGVPNAEVAYTAIFTCTFAVIDPCGPPYCCPIVLDPCTKNAWFGADITTFMPMIDELWSKTVTGTASIFRKFFSQVGSSGTLEKFKDTPTLTQVTHFTKNLDDDPPAVTTLLSTDAKLYFPHLGGIYNYFLKDLQTLIRPQGFAAQFANLANDATIEELESANEYVSWYLNGTLNRAEGDPLSIEESTSAARAVTMIGPLNKLLPQELQWRNTVKDSKKQLTGRSDQVDPRATENRSTQKDGRHDQYVACTQGIDIPGPIKSLISAVLSGSTAISKLLNVISPFNVPDLAQLLGIDQIGGFPKACRPASIENLEKTITTGASPSPIPGVCKSSIPPLKTAPGCSLSKSQIGSVSIPPTLKKIFETAGATYNIPPDLVAGVMFAEGGFEPRTTDVACYGPYTEENIQQAALCEFPNCNPDKYSPPCNYNSAQGPGSCINGGTHFGPFQQCPNGYNPCNIYDAVMNAAKSLAAARYASNSGIVSCLGQDLTNPQATGTLNCSKSAWTCEDVITALTNWEGSCQPTSTGSASDHTCLALSVYGACNSNCP